MSMYSTMNRKEVYMAAAGVFPDEIVSATELECENELRTAAGYCDRRDVTRCAACPLSHDGRDCHNNKVA